MKYVTAKGRMAKALYNKFMIGRHTGRAIKGFRGSELRLSLRKHLRFLYLSAPKTPIKNHRDAHAFICHCGEKPTKEG